MWAEYRLADLDLTEETGVQGTRMFRDGRLSLNGNRIFVRVFGRETPWDNEQNIYNTNLEARKRLNQAMYVAPLTPEQIAEELALSKASNRARLNKVVSQVRTRYSDGLVFEGYVESVLLAEAEKVKAAGYAEGVSPYVDDMATRLRNAPLNTNKIKAITDNIISDGGALRDFMIATENIRKDGYQAIFREEEFRPMIDELRALFSA